MDEEATASSILPAATSAFGCSSSSSLKFQFASSRAPAAVCFLKWVATTTTLKRMVCLAVAEREHEKQGVVERSLAHLRTLYFSTILLLLSLLPGCDDHSENIGT